MAQPLVPELLRTHLAELASRDQRADGRGRWEGRELSLE
ncbi:MAG TPA: RNA-binding protein, partial [Candidatus Poseidoniales archaeon]|nr:RNA-binding protein [Candidatus Poseidoniales archaeon]